MAGRANQSFVVVFVEGETDFQFFTKLLKYYKQNSSSSIRRYKIVQMNGVSHFTSTLPSEPWTTSTSPKSEARGECA